MIGTLHCHNQRFEVDYAAGIRLGWLMDTASGKPFFVDERVQRTALSGDGFTGRISSGASCNVDRIELIPHCHGTHTEGIGHVLEEQLSVLDTADLSPALARLVTPHLSTLDQTEERYHHPVADAQTFITRDALQQQLGQNLSASLNAVIVRSRWSEQPDAPYPLLTSEAAQWLAESTLRQLLIDTPSLDAEDDHELGNHRRWWGLHVTTQDYAAPARQRSITEFLNIPVAVPDGYYLLHTGIAPLASDASPSQPIIYPLSPY